MDQRSPASGDKIRILRTCQSCEQEFDATALTLGARMAGIRPKTYLCPPCGAKAWAEEQKAQERLLAIHEAGDVQRLVEQEIPPRYRDKTLGGFEQDGNEDALRSIQDWVRRFPPERPKGYPSLYMCSRNNGVGKTHLACAALHQLIQRDIKVIREHGWERCPYQLESAVGLKIQVRQSMAYGADPPASKLYALLGSCSLLVLDDVGKEQLAGADGAFLQELYFNVVNERYNRELPLIITANIPLQEPWADGELTLETVAGLAVVSRLREMCQGKEIVIHGTDRRGTERSGT